MSRIYKIMVKALGRVLDSGRFPLPDAAEPIETDKNALLTFIAWGDPQISCISPLRSARVYSACRDLEQMKGKADALILAGDITEYGAGSEYRMAARLIGFVADKFTKIYAVTGNHDIRLRPYKRQTARFADFLGSLANGVPNSRGRYYFSDELCGYKFIMMGADRSAFEASYISRRQLDFLDSELEKSDKSKPVFVINHQPLKHTNGLPETFLGKGKWRGSVGNESDSLRAVFEKYENVIYITGHLHYCTNKYTYEDCGRFKSVSLPTIGVLNHGDFDKLTQGLIFSVYADRIEVRSRVFGEGRYAPDSIDNSSFTIPLQFARK